MQFKLPTHITIITLFLLFVISLISECLAQKFINLKTYDVDSLLQVLPGQVAEDRVNTLNNLAVSLSFIDFDSSMQYTDEAIILAKELDYKIEIANAFMNYGHIFSYEGFYPQALTNYLEALSIYENIKEKHKAAWACYHIAKTHWLARNYEKSIKYGNLALDKFRERIDGGATVGNKSDTLMMYASLGLVYDRLGEREKAIELYRLALSKGERGDIWITESLLYNFRIGAVYSLMGDLSNAKVYFDKILAFPDDNSDVRTLKYRAVTGLGNIYSHIGKIDTAKIYLQRAYEWYDKNGFLFWSMYVSSDLGEMYYKYNDIETAEKYFKKSEMVFNEMLTKNSWYKHDSLKYVVNFGLELFFPFPHRKLHEMMWVQGKRMYYNLYQISKEKGSAIEALDYHIAFFNTVDTLNRLQRNREIIELQTKYENERQEEQIVNLSRENEFQEFRLKQSGYFLLGLSGLVILVVILAIVFIRQNKLREQQKNLLLQQKLFRSQMNPHFIFNSLTSIQNYILDEKADKASKYLSRFSKLIRHILDSSIQENVLLTQEISTIENYLELQQLRFQNKFDYSIEVENTINPESVDIPPMLAQPFIENSIEHGIKYKKIKGNIQIRFRLVNSYLYYEVQDDGVGRNEAQEILFKLNKDHKSLATAITRERIQVLNKKRNRKITLQILDLTTESGDATGTKVILKIPV